MKTLDSIIDGIFDAAKTVRYCGWENTQRMSVLIEFYFFHSLNPQTFVNETLKQKSCLVTEVKNLYLYLYISSNCNYQANKNKIGVSSL